MKLSTELNLTKLGLSFLARIACKRKLIFDRDSYHGSIPEVGAW